MVEVRCEGGGVNGKGFGVRGSEIGDFLIGDWGLGTTQWTATLSSKVKMLHAINFRAFSCEKLVKKPRRFWEERNPRSPPNGGVWSLELVFGVLSFRFRV